MIEKTAVMKSFKPHLFIKRKEKRYTTFASLPAFAILPIGSLVRPLLLCSNAEVLASIF